MLAQRIYGRWSALLVASALSVPLHAQEAPGYQELLDVTLVNVDVVVLDREGNRVQGLTAENFEVLENGVPQKITNFAAYSFDSRGPAAAGRAGHRSLRPPLQIALFVDEGLYERGAQKNIEEMLGTFVKQHLRPGDHMDVFSWNRRLVRLTPRDADAEAITGAIGLAFQSAREGALRAPKLDENALRAEQSYERVLAELNDFDELPEEWRVPTVQTTTRLAAADQSENVRLKKRALANVALEMGANPGRKALLIVSSSFGRYEPTRLFTPDPGIEGIPLSAKAYDTRGEAEELARAANASGVTVYALYPGTRESDFAEATHEAMRDTGGVGSTLPLRIADTDSLQFLATTTGGVVALSPGRIPETLRGVGEDLASYYSLAYKSDLEDGETRALDVRTTVPGLEVRTRDSVTRTPAAERMAARVRNNVFRRTNSGIRLQVEVAPPTQRRADPRKAVDLILRFPALDLLLLADEENAVGRFTISIAAGDENFGNLSPISTERRTFEIPLHQVSELGSHEIVYRTTVRFDQRTTVISVGVRDEQSDVSGFVRVGINRATRTTS